MTKVIEDRVRKIEDTLLLLPVQLESINNNQVEIKEHLETINGTFGDFDDRLRSVETIQDYDDMRKGEKKENKKNLISASGVLLVGIAVTQGLVVAALALS